MTPKKRKEHLAQMKQILTNYGFKEDNYGNFLYPGIKDFRFKFKKVNVRQEIKAGGRWLSGGFSKPYSKVELVDWESRVKHYQQMMIDKLPKKEVKPPKPRMRKTMDASTKSLQSKLTHMNETCALVLENLVDEGHIERLRLKGDTIRIYNYVQRLVKERKHLTQQLEDKNG